MKKLFFNLIAMLVAFQATSQEFLKVEYSWIDKDGYPGVHLSNGVEVWRRACGHYHSNNKDNPEVKTNFKKRTKYPKGAVIYHQGNIYKFEKVILRGTYTITEVFRDEVNVETQGNINGDISYNALFGFATFYGGGGIGNAKGQISGSMRGGTKTVVNVFFGDGKYATIIAAEDPIWVRAKPGMKIQHYTVRDVNVYKLIVK